MSKTASPDYGDLMIYSTGEFIRKATREEREQSDAEVESGNAQGTIVVDGVTCYVDP